LADAGDRNSFRGSSTSDTAGTLSPAELNRTLLARQLLLERAELPLPSALEQMGFLQAQYAPSMYIGLWSRVEGFRREELTRALEDGVVVQGTLLRATIHLVSADDWWPASLAIRQHRRRWWLRAHQHRPSLLSEVESAAARVRDLLVSGPRKRTAIVAELGIDSVVWGGVNVWLDLLRVPPSGTWEHRRADLYALAEQRLGPPPPTVTEDSGLELLLRRYLGGFGPAPLRDVANWAGVPVEVVKPIADRLELRRFLDDGGDQLLDLPRAPIAGATAVAPVRFLPTWDATLLAHARRTQILREEHRPLLFSTKSPQSKPSFLVDGQVAGTWRYDRARIQTEFFDGVSADARREVDAEAERVLEFHR
jgi:hypothetical protein